MPNRQASFRLKDTDYTLRFTERALFMFEKERGCSVLDTASARGEFSRSDVHYYLRHGLEGHRLHTRLRNAEEWTLDRVWDLLDGVATTEVDDVVWPAIHQAVRVALGIEEDAPEADDSEGKDPPTEP